MSAAQVFQTTIASPSGPFLLGRYAVDSVLGTSPSSTARIGDAAAGSAFRCEMALSDAAAVKESVHALIGDTPTAAGSRGSEREATSVDILEPTEGGIIEVRTKGSTSKAMFIDRTVDLADFDAIMDGLIAGVLAP